MDATCEKALDREEDRNTQYFHPCANQRKKKNFIPSLVMETNEEIETESEIEKAFYHYFTKPITTSSPSQEDIVQSSHAIRLKVTTKMNAQLLRRFTKEEVRVALM